jgi:hypothetical protein
MITGFAPPPPHPQQLLLSVTIVPSSCTHKVSVTFQLYRSMHSCGELHSCVRCQSNCESSWGNNTCLLCLLWWYHMCLYMLLPKFLTLSTWITYFVLLFYGDHVCSLIHSLHSSHIFTIRICTYQQIFGPGTTTFSNGKNACPCNNKKEGSISVEGFFLN